MFETLPFLLLFALGILFKRMKVLRKEDSHVLGRLLMTAVLPATVFGAISTAQVKADYLLLPVVGILVDTLMLLAAYGLAKLLNLQSRTRGAFLVAFPTLEIGTIGYAIISSTRGMNGLTILSMVDIGNAFFFFSVLAFLASSLGSHQERFQVIPALKRFARTPIILAFGCGLLVNLLHIQLPPMVSELRAAISQSLIFLIMMLLAAEFELTRIPLTLSALTIYLKTGIGIVLGVLISSLFGFNGIERIGIVVAASLPPSLLSVVFAKDNELDAQFLASLCSIALPVAIVVSSIIALI